MKDFHTRPLVLTVFLVVILHFTTTCVAGFEEDECEINHFKCAKSKKCIPISWRCDSDADCNDPDDKSDEENCPPKTCSSDEFMCGSGGLGDAKGKCIPMRWTCDGEPDCDDRSDEHEKICALRTCKSNEFDCGDSCVPQIWRCDRTIDCVDGKDEENCDVSLNVKTCPSTDFQCVSDGRCIDQIWYCDGDQDCLDGSDERDCKPKVCKEDEFNCSDSSMCIDKKWKCDGDFDCADHSDERDCKGTIFDGEGHLCSDTDFTCASGDECIHKTWACDGDQDCLDGSDEGDHCEYTPCREDQFTCADHNCIPLDLHCNHFYECADHSDEVNCTHKTCEEIDEFDCYGDGSFCIPHDKVCDGHNDCQHREDEETAMCKHTNPCDDHFCDKHSTCIQVYNHTSKAVAKCECDRGFEMHSDGYCLDINECQQDAECSQICTNTEGSYKCSCRDGYVLESNNFCRAQGEQPWLYYANRRDIRRLRVDSRYMEIIIEDTRNSIALDVDYNDDVIFWTDGAKEQIHSAKLKDTAVLAEEKTTVVSNGVHSPDGLAVDWLYKHIYWTDTGHDTISVASYDGTQVRTLISSDLDDPRAISVDPEYGYMYWTDWGQKPKIERCGMDGKNRMSIVTQEHGLEWPNGLTIDYISKRIYWIDAKLHKIGTTAMDGSDRKFVVVNPSEISRPFSISVFEDSLYWTDWNTNSIKSVNKKTGRSLQTLSLGSYSVMDIKVYHEMRQERHFAENATKLCQAKQCEHLCLPHAREVQSLPTVSCVCSNGYQLNADQQTCTQSAVTTQKPVTTQKQVTTQKAETTKAAEATTKAPVVTTGSGYTILPPENKTESVPKVQPEGSSGIIAVITSVIVAVILIALFIVGIFVFRRWSSKNRKSMNFDNPVYRKTTTTDDQCMLEEEGQIDIPSHMQPLRRNEEV